MKSGEITNNGSGRWCEVCDTVHGILYNCPNYPPDVRAEIKSQMETWERNLNSEEWVKEQMDNGVPPLVIEMQRFFVGL